MISPRNPSFDPGRPEDQANYFVMEGVQLRMLSQPTIHSSLDLDSDNFLVLPKVSNARHGILFHLRRAYYRYEVTFGLYVMSTAEKVIVNSIILLILGLLITAIFFYLPALVIRLITRTIWYIYGPIAEVSLSSNAFAQMTTVTQIVLGCRPGAANVTANLADIIDAPSIPAQALVVATKGTG